MHKKTAIICFNLGGPDSLEAVQPFLFNLFNDKAIIRLPALPRYLLARLISTKRAPVAQEIYGHIGNKSPLLELTTEQTQALEQSLNGQSDTEYKAFICMRYWHPMTKEVVQQVKDWLPDEIILLPLYPQFSTTTTGSSIGEWHKEVRKAKLDVPTFTVGCYPKQAQFIEAHAQLINASIAKAADKPFRLLFSAHGLPEKIVAAGDPYQWQVEQTVAEVMKRLLNEHKDAPDHVICYQSRVGPLKWIGPSTEDEIHRAGEDGKTIIMIPIAFVSEHSETLVELDIEYKELAEEKGVTDYIRVPALATQPAFIESLKQMVLKAQQSGQTISCCGKRICPKECSGCVCYG